MVERLSVVYVRPGKRVLALRSSIVFGSAIGWIRYELGPGAEVGAIAFSDCNGFVREDYYSVLLPAGSSITVEDWCSTSGTSITTYVVDVDAWRLARRAKLAQFISRKVKDLELAKALAARKSEILAALRGAISRGEKRVAVVLAKVYVTEICRRVNTGSHPLIPRVGRIRPASFFSKYQFRSEDLPVDCRVVCSWGSF